MDEDYARRLREWLRAEPGATPRQAAEEREWLREIPQPGSAGDERGRPPGERLPAPEPAPEETWSVRGQLPAAHPATADDEWICPVIALPVPRPSRENGCRMSEAEARSRWNHPSNRDRRAEPVGEHSMSEAEARSRWNHPTNWHRRRREAGQPEAGRQRRDQPGSR
ncbi:hypothetical protein [Amycolatopsis sp. NPDC021455]|uniref:hypothetical protein n=1 Tax=Amycolatopsis sp. NPDC021455 TaxID=3154901 RepID=UPI00340390B9